MKQLFVLLSLLGCCDLSFGQNYQWTWVSGYYSPSLGSTSVGKGISDPSNFPGCREPAASWVDKDGNFWVFGGEAGWYMPITETGAGDLNDLWKYTPSTNEWTWVSGDAGFNQPAVYGTKGVPSINNKPGARTRSVSWIDKNGNLWLFGGVYGAFGGGTTSYYNDLWKFDPSTSEWTWVSGSNLPNQAAVYGVKGMPSPTNVPPGLARAMCWTDHNGIFWLYGGIGASATADDLWRYDPATDQWTWVRGNHAPGFGAVWGTMKIPSPSNSPGARIDAAAWVDAKNNLWLFGAGPGANLWNDLWKYDPVLDEWTWINGQSTSSGLSAAGAQGVAAPGNQPSCRYGAASMVDGAGNLWLFGGYGMGNDAVSSHIDMLNDLWKYDPAADQWTWVSGQLAPSATAVYGTKGVSSSYNQPGGRIWSAGWADASNQLWIFGGSGYGTGSSGPENDLWKFATPVGIAITQLSATAVCAGAGLQVSFAVSGPLGTGNVFSAQLSDASGSWAAPVSIGTLSGGSGGVLSAVIPSNTPAGSHYRIRVISSSPGEVSIDNGSDITVFGSMTVALTAINTTNICPGTSASLSAAASGGKPPYLYSWSNGATGAGITVAPAADITLNLTVTDDGCGSATYSVPLTVAVQRLTVDGNALLCPNSSILLNAHSGYSSYLWQDGSMDSTLVVRQSGVYQVSVVTGCGTVLQQEVTVSDAPPLPTSLLPGDTAICSYDALTVKAGGEFGSYAWSTGATSSSITIDKPGLYWLEVEDDNSCIVRDSIRVDMKQCLEGFFMPSAFSPNGDGHNDVLRPKLYGRVVRMRFAVWDRWGTKVFETAEKDGGWDGRLASGVIAAGTYVWTCEYQFEGQPVRTAKGAVVSIR